MILESLIIGGMALAILAYLGYALLYPERL